MVVKLAESGLPNPVQVSGVYNKPASKIGPQQSSKVQPFAIVRQLNIHQRLVPSSVGLLSARRAPSEAQRCLTQQKGTMATLRCASASSFGDMHAECAIDYV